MSQAKDAMQEGFENECASGNIGFSGSLAPPTIKRLLYEKSTGFLWTLTTSRYYTISAAMAPKAASKKGEL